MARRISSIFSLGSNSSGTSSNDPRSSSLFQSGEPAKEKASPNLDSTYTPDLRPSTPASRFQDVQYHRDGRQTPPIDTSRRSPQVQPTLSAPLYPLEETGAFDMLHPPELRKPLPEQRAGSPIGSRPTSRPISRPGSGFDSRPTSRAGPGRDHSAPHSRAGSPSKLRSHTPTSESSNRSSRRMSWIPGRNRSASRGEEVRTPIIPPGSAWLLAPSSQDKTHYDLSSLTNFQAVPELWDDHGNTYIYLHAREGGQGPSFKIDSALFAASRILAVAAYGGSSTNDNGRRESSDRKKTLLERTAALKLDTIQSGHSSRYGSSDQSSSSGGRSSPSFLDSEERSKIQDVHMCIPLPLHANLADPNSRLASDDVEVLVAIRNVFAFLAGKPLVATSKRPSLYLAFLEVADLLRRYEFTNLDGSTLGEEAYASFGHYVSDFNMADIRSSREKTIEAIVLGERMKYWPLFSEGFVHGVGKFDDIVNLHSAKFDLITAVTRKKMERAALDLSIRLRNVRGRLEDFDFPALFAGIANSKTSSERKVIRFSKWKDSYMSMRSHVLSIYKQRYGAWPPKARSRKNDFEQSGLNRLLLRELSNDFSDLYDLLVDRNAETTRNVDIPSDDIVGDGDPEEPTARALRRVLDEYDRSTPPVQPPVPFDIPKLPSLAITRTGHSALEPSKRKKHEKKKLPDGEIRGVTMGSYNSQSLKGTPFILAFGEFERRQARGKSIEEIVDLRVGQWIFMYAVLQALPLVVVDAPNLQYTDAVEYFLCEVPKGSPPWVLQESHHQKQSWYGIAGGTGMVSLPADVVEHGVDGIYRRSHCWIMAEQWTGSTTSHPPDLGFDTYPIEGQQAAPGTYSTSNSGYAPDYYYPSHPNQNPHPSANGHMLSPNLPPPPVPAHSSNSSQSRNQSRSPVRGHSPRRASMVALAGLEQLPLPQGVTPSGSRPVSVHDPNKTFSSIMAAGNSPGVKGKKK